MKVLAPDSLSKEWLEIVNRHKKIPYSEKREDELTLVEYASMMGCSINTARRYLEEDIKAGLVTVRKLLKGPAMIAVYSPTNQTIN